MDARFYGRAIRLWREKARITQAHLARSAGIPQNTLSALENRGQGMKKDLFIRLCRLIDADPLVVADHAYYEFRRLLGEEADRLEPEPPGAGDGGRGAVPSLEEVMGLYDTASASSRSFCLAVLRLLRHDLAVSAFLEDRFRNLDPGPEPPRGRPRGKRRTAPGPPRRKP